MPPVTSCTSWRRRRAARCGDGFIGWPAVPNNTLRENLALWAQRVDDVRYDISYRRITYAPGDKVYVEVRYGGSFHISRPATEDEQWSRRLSNHRLILQKLPEAEGEDEFRILSGM